MLRHFAAVTLVATAGLAMFANGENTSALAEARKAAEARGGGAWGTSPKKADENKGPRTVNGMTLASGTKLERNPGYSDEPEIHRIEQEIQGDIRYLDPAYRASAAGMAGPGPQAAAGGAQPIAAPAPIQRDRNGIPLPPGKTGQVRPSINAKPLPPARPTQQDIDQMMEASLLRSSTGSAGSGSNGGPAPTQP